MLDFSSPMCDLMAGKSTGLILVSSPKLKSLQPRQDPSGGQR